MHHLHAMHECISDPSILLLLKLVPSCRQQITMFFGYAGLLEKFHLLLFRCVLWQIYQMEQGGEASVLGWVCRLTLFIAPALSM